MKILRYSTILFLFISCEDIGGNYGWQGIGFTRSYGNLGYDYGWNAAYSPFDGGVIVVGERQEELFGQTDLWAIKTDNRGLIKWEKIFGGKSNDVGYDVISTSDGGFLFVGYSWSFGKSQQIYVIKTDFHGNVKWEKTYGGSNWDVGNAVIEVNDGGYLIAGYSNSPGISSGNTDVFIVKIDVNGKLIWQKAYGKSGSYNHEWAYDIISDASNGSMIVGARDYYNQGKRNILLLNVDINGELLWEKEFSESGAVDEIAHSISYTNNGNYFICSKVNSLSKPGVYQPKIIKIDNRGNIDWQRTFASNGRIYHEYKATGTASGDIVIVGSSSHQSAGGYKDDAFMIRVSEKGNIIWTNSYGSADHDDWGWSVFETPNTDLVFVGSTKSFGASLFDIFLMGTNADGISN